MILNIPRSPIPERCITPTGDPRIAVAIKQQKLTSACSSLKLHDGCCTVRDGALLQLVFFGGPRRISCLSCCCRITMAGPAVVVRSNNALRTSSTFTATAPLGGVVKPSTPSDVTTLSSSLCRCRGLGLSHLALLRGLDIIPRNRLPSKLASAKWGGGGVPDGFGEY